MNYTYFIVPMVFLSSGVFSEESKILPNQFQRLWDISDEKCQSKWSDSKLNITNRLVEYWESNGKPLRVTQENERTIVVRLAMFEEEEKWVAKTKFVVTNDKITEYLENGDVIVRIRCK